jgi:hypothetical protein
VGLDIPFVVKDISASGFSVESNVCFPVADHRLFELESPFLGSTLVVSARATRSVSAEGPYQFLTGFEYTPHQPLTSAGAIEEWVNLMAVTLDDNASAAAPPRGRERRQLPRLEVVGQLYGEVQDRRIPFVVRDISAGGINIETHAPLVEGSSHHLRLDLVDDVSVTVRARVAHVRDEAVNKRQPKFQIGMTFQHDTPSTRDAVGIILDQITAALTFV